MFDFLWAKKPEDEATIRLEVHTPFRSEPVFINCDPMKTSCDDLLFLILAECSVPSISKTPKLRFGDRLLYRRDVTLATEEIPNNALLVMSWDTGVEEEVLLGGYLPMDGGD